MQDDVNNKTVALSVKGAKLTGRLLAKAMQAFLRQARASPKIKTGKQSVKSLAKQGATLSDIEITGDNIGDFKRIARKYNVGYALKRDDSETQGGQPPKWIVFFKAKDADALTAAFKEYSKITLKVKETRKPNFLAKIAKFRQKAKEYETPAKNRAKEGHEL
ncbi:hypothetical protein FACS1894133_5720 [Clostridia bacterium]|nr:hypothetical protein FACS1894133_5720 [Clostridia bacterium]